MIASNSAIVDGPILAASAMILVGVHSAYRRCALGMCSAIVVCRLRTAEKAWLATRVPRSSAAPRAAGATARPARRPLQCCGRCAGRSGETAIRLDL